MDYNSGSRQIERDALEHMPEVINPAAAGLDHLGLMG
jgi:hypothetical protein